MAWRMIVVIALVFGSFVAYGNTRFEVFVTGIAPKVQKPYPDLNGNLHFVRILAPQYYDRQKTSGAIERCVLLHGHGITAGHVRTLTVPANAKARPVLSRLHGDLPSLFAKFAFGPYFLEQLSTKACNEVMVILAESSQTSILELTRQVEVFLKTEACKAVPPKSQNRSCALFGHSKGAVVATSIARRCVQKRADGMGAIACARLAAVYAAGGPNLGSTSTALLAGSRELGDKFAYEDIFDLGIDVFLKQSGQILGSDTSGVHVDGQTNPVWFDLSPAATMEDNTPLFEHHEDLVLTHDGWFRGMYAASAGRFEFARDDRKGVVIGHGQIGAPSSALFPVIVSLLDFVYARFGEVMNEVHSPRMERYFKAGIPLYGKYFANPDQVLAHFTWQRHQISDGLVEVDSALGPCVNSLEAGSPAVADESHCKVFENIHHLGLSGGSQEAADHMIETLKMASDQQKSWGKIPRK